MATTTARAQTTRDFPLTRHADQALMAATGLRAPAAPVVLNMEPGCNAAWDGRSLLLLSGNAECVAAHQIPDLVLHEYGHRLTQFLIGMAPMDQASGEALADLFASIFSTDSLIAEGFYPARGISWLRDLSERRHYPEQARGTYSESLTLSTALYPIFRALTSEQGLQLWVQIHQELRPDIRPDVSRTAAAALAATRALLSPALQCETYRSMYQNGLAGEDSTFCAATPAALEIQIQTLTDRWLITAPAGARISVRKNGEPATARTRFTCGDRLDYQVVTLDAQGRVEARAAGTKWWGEVAGSRTTQQIPLLGRTPVPENSEGAAWQAQFTAGASERILSAQLLLRVNHLYPDDLVLDRQVQGRFTDWIKGHEEVDFPSVVTLPLTTSAVTLDESFRLRDRAAGIPGELREVKLLVQTAHFECH